MIRWSYFLPRLAVVLLILAAFRWGLPFAMHRALEGGAQRVIGAKTDIDRVQLSLPRGELILHGVEVADPRDEWTNIVQFSSARLYVDPRAAASRRLVVREGTIRDLTFGTEREVSGKLETEPSDDRWVREFRHWQSSWLQAWGEDLESRLAEESELVQVGRDLMERWPREYEELSARVMQWRRDVEDLQQWAERQRDVRQVNPQEIPARMAQLQGLVEAVPALQQDFERLARQAQADARAIDLAREHDLEKVASVAYEVGVDPRTLQGYLLGPEIDARLRALPRWGARVRQVLSAARKPALNRGRGRGVDIPFASNGPPLLFEHLLVDGRLGEGDRTRHFRGELYGLTPNPTRNAQPIQGEFEVGREAPIHVTFRLEPGDPPPLRLRIDAPRTHSGRQTLGDADRLALTIEPADAAVTAQLEIVGDRVQGWVQYEQSDLHVVPIAQDVPEPVAVAWRTAAGSLKRLDVKVQIDGELGDPDLQLTTSLGDDMAGALREGLEAAVVSQAGAWEQQVAARHNEILTRYESRRMRWSDSIVGQLDFGERLLAQLQQTLSAQLGSPAILGGRVPSSWLSR